MSMLAVCQLNSAAVTNVCDCKQGDALEKLKAAVFELKALLGCFAATDGLGSGPVICSGVDAVGKETMNLVAAGSALHLSTHGTNHNLNNASDTPNHNSCLFNRAFLVAAVGPENASHDPDERTVMLLSMVVLYNLGLCYHLKGLAQGNNTKRLQSAFQMYGMAVSVIVDQNGEGWFLSDDQVFVLLAIFSNMAHIKSLLMDGEAVKGLVESMKQLVNVHVWSPHRTSEAHQHLTFFLRVVLAGPNHDFRFAAAA